MSEIDFSNWTYNTLPERTGNVGWQPDLQDLIYTAINHVEGDYEDADENCAEQVIERLVLAIKSLLGPSAAEAVAHIAQVDADGAVEAFEVYGSEKAIDALLVRAGNGDWLRRGKP